MKLNIFLSIDIELLQISPKIDHETEGSFGDFNILRSRQNELHFPDDIFKCIFLNENLYISI